MSYNLFIIYKCHDDVVVSLFTYFESNNSLEMTLISVK